MPETVSIPGGSELDFLKDMRGRRDEALEGLQHVHDEAIDDMRMLLNENGEGQWNSETLEYRKKLVPPRPCITDNVMASFGERVKNEHRRNRPSVRCNPVDDKADPDTATIIAGLIRNIHYQSNADAVHDLAFDSTVDMSLGAWRIISEYADPMSFDQELRIRPIGSAIVNNPLSVWWDLTCKNFVTSDKQFCGIDTVMSREAAKKRFKRDVFPSSSDWTDGTSKADWFLEDAVRFIEYLYVVEKPKKILLLNNGKVMIKDDKNMQLIERLKRRLQGLRIVDERDTQIPEINSCICSGNEVLEGPYLIPGRYIPVILTFGKILNEEGKLHIKSLHRDAKSGQELHNYIISTILEQFSLQPSVPWLVTSKMIENHVEIWKRANEGGLAYLEYTPDPTAVGLKPTREAPPQVNIQMFGWLEQNMNNLRNVYGIQEAAMGMASNEKSGKAINARKAQSDLITSVFMSNFLLALQFEGKILTEQIPHYYDAPRAQMITGLDGNVSKVMLNQAFTVETPQGPKTMMYDMKAGKYDVVITVGPTATSMRDETMQTLSEMIQAIAQTNPMGAQLLTIEQLKLLNTPDHDRIIKMIKKTLPPEIQAAMDELDSGMPGAQGGEAQTAQLQGVIQQQAQQLQQMQAAVQELQTENQRLAQEESVKMAKIAAIREESAEKIALRQTELKAEYDYKYDLAQKDFEVKIKRITEEFKLLDLKYTAELVHKDRQHDIDRGAPQAEPVGAGERKEGE